MARKNDGMTIDVRRQKAMLSSLKLPYTVYQTDRFNIDEYIEDIEYEPEGKKAQFIGRNKQCDHWEACLDTEMQGWTGIVSCTTDISRGEAAAATIAASYIDANKNVAWHNCTSNRFGRDAVLQAIVNPRPLAATDLLVVTGLRMEGDPVRIDKTFDLLREAPEKSSKLIVATGADPITISRKLGLPIQRAIYLRHYFEIDM